MQNQTSIPQKALFKWIGGKKWLSKEIEEIINRNLNEKIDTYIEPFAGGLGSFKTIYPILIKNNVKTIILNDINTDIINTFRTIKDSFEKLTKEYEKLYFNFIKTFPEHPIKSKKVTKEGIIEGDYYFTDLNKTKDKKELKEKFLNKSRDYFNEIKKEFNELKAKREVNEKRAAMFLFLMDNCFNGVYRENQKGEYNVPFNWDNKKIDMKTKMNNLEEYHIFFNNINIIFENRDVFEVIKKYNKKNEKTFIYLDPPYANEKEGTENKYNKEVFNNKNQRDLIKLIEPIDYILYSNHYIDWIKKEFDKQSNKIQDCNQVLRKNIMSASNESRKEDKKEILIFVKTK